MKKLLGALVVGTAVFGAVIVSASNLPLVNGTGVIQAGGATGLACQTTPVKIGYTTQINGQGLDEVTGVVLSNIDAACYGKWADVSVMPAPPYGGGVPWIASGWGNLDSDSSTTFDLQSTTNPLASDVGNVQVAIRDQ